jgi:hypothetical protein
MFVLPLEILGACHFNLTLWFLASLMSSVPMTMKRKATTVYIKEKKGDIFTVVAVLRSRSRIIFLERAGAAAEAASFFHSGAGGEAFQNGAVVLHSHNTYF